MENEMRKEIQQIFKKKDKIENIKQQLTITSMCNEKKNKKEEAQRKLKLKCIHAGACPNCGQTLVITKILNTKIKIHLMFYLVLIYISFLLLFTKFMPFGIIGIIIGILVLLTKITKGWPTCPNCGVLEVSNRSIDDEEHHYYTECINTELKNYYRDKLFNRYDYGD